MGGARWPGAQRPARSPGQHARSSGGSPSRRAPSSSGNSSASQPASQPEGAFVGPLWPADQPGAALGPSGQLGPSLWGSTRGYVEKWRPYTASQPHWGPNICYCCCCCCWFQRVPHGRPPILCWLFPISISVYLGVRASAAGWLFFVCLLIFRQHSSFSI